MASIATTTALHFTLLVATFIRPAVAQDVAAALIPTAVREALDARVSGLQVVAWKLDANHDYQATFRSRGSNVIATFTPQGVWIESATTIGAVTLPDRVKSAVVRRFKGYRFVETRRVERAGLPPLLFEVHLANSRGALTVQLKPDGTVFSPAAKP